MDEIRRALNENSIFNLSKLEMFVDELPDMPTLLGYGVDRNGSFVAGNLIIGMYQKFWVKYTSSFLVLR